MSNLIEKDNQGNWMLKGVPWKMLRPGVAITKDVCDRLYGALWKLMEYEDTGLSPEQVERIKDNMTAMELKSINKNQVGR